MAEIKVSRLPHDPGPAGWNRILPDPAPAQVLEDRITADWLVIGAGFAGLAAARRLSENCPGDKIVVLDATRIGDGPAGRNSGFMIDLPHDLSSDTYGGDLEADLAQIADNRTGITFAAEMAADFGLSEEAFSLAGKTNAAATPKGLDVTKHYAAHLKRLGEDHEVLSSEDMRQMTGTDYYIGGLFTPGAAMIQPALFVRGVANGLRSNRIQIFENSPVVSLKHESNWIAETTSGRVTAPNVILAVNGHLNSFGFAKRRLVHVLTYASMTRALSGDEIKTLGGRATWGVTSADPMGTSVRRISGLGGDRIVIRNTFTYEPSLTAGDDKVDTIGRSHDKSFKARFPALAHVAMEHRWGGRLCLSRNNVQKIGRLDDGLYSACCQNGLGTAKGTLAGRLAADLATGVSSASLDRALSAPPPAALPPEPIAKIGASARIALGQIRAGRER